MRLEDAPLAGLGKALRRGSKRSRLRLAQAVCPQNHTLAEVFRGDDGEPWVVFTVKHNRTWEPWLRDNGLSAPARREHVALQLDPSAYGGCRTRLLIPLPPPESGVRMMALSDGTEAVAIVGSDEGEPTCRCTEGLMYPVLLDILLEAVALGVQRIIIPSVSQATTTVVPPETL